MINIFYHDTSRINFKSGLIHACLLSRSAIFDFILILRSESKSSPLNEPRLIEGQALARIIFLLASVIGSN